MKINEKKVIVKIPKIELKGDRILLFRPLIDLSKQIYIPERYLPYSHYGVVVAKGDECSSMYEVGDKVVIAYHTGIQLWDEMGMHPSSFFVVRESEILGKITEGEFNPEAYEKK